MYIYILLAFTLFTNVFIMVSLYVDPKRKPSSPILLFYPIKIGIDPSFSLLLDSFSILSFQLVTFSCTVSYVKCHGIVVEDSPIDYPINNAN